MHKSLKLVAVAALTAGALLITGCSSSKKKTDNAGANQPAGSTSASASTGSGAGSGSTPGGGSTPGAGSSSGSGNGSANGKWSFGEAQTQYLGIINQLSTDKDAVDKAIAKGDLPATKAACGKMADDESAASAQLTAGNWPITVSPMIAKVQSDLKKDQNTFRGCANANSMDEVNKILATRDPAFELDSKLVKAALGVSEPTKS